MLFNFLLAPHVIAGSLSILLFWIPAFSKKGGRIHVLSGKTYVVAMWIVVISAALMCLIRIADGKYETAIFLGFLSLISAKPLWLGIAVFKDQNMGFWRMKQVLELIIVAGGIAMFTLGILWWGKGTSILMMIFGSLGIVGFLEYKMSRRKDLGANIIQTHMREMIISGIAAYTAFLAFGARQFLQSLLSGYWSVIPWILPTVFGFLCIRILMGKYERKKVPVSEY